MEELKERIRREGHAIGDDLLKVDSFLNHQIDGQLMSKIGKAFADRFKDKGITKILTAEASGIPPALVTGIELGVPVIYARKTKPDTMRDRTYSREVMSATKGEISDIVVSAEYIGPDDRILIIDDFIASGATILALASIVREAGASLVGVGTVIEKAFLHGRERLWTQEIPLESLAIVESLRGGVRVR